MINKTFMLNLIIWKSVIENIFLFLCPDNFKEIQRPQVNKIKTELRLQ